MSQCPRYRDLTMRRRSYYRYVEVGSGGPDSRTYQVVVDSYADSSDQAREEPPGHQGTGISDVVTLALPANRQPRVPTRIFFPPRHETPGGGRLRNRPLNAPLRRVDLQPMPSIAMLNTVSMLAVQPKQDGRLQVQDIFINSMVESLERQATTPMLAISLAPGQQAEAERRQIVVNTASGAAVAGIGDFISSLLRYATNVVMTHLVTQSVYGIFVEANTVATILGYASKLGLDSATLRFLSTYQAKGERALAAGLIRFASLVALISGIIWAILFFVSSTALSLAVYHTAVYELPFKEIALLIPLIGLQLVFASGLQALKAIKWKVYVDRLIQPGLTLVFLSCSYLAGLRLEA